MERTHRCLYGDELEGQVFAALRAEECRRRRRGRVALALGLLAVPGWAIGAQATHIIQALTLGFSFAFTLLGLGLLVASRRRMSYPEAFVAAGLEPLTAAEHLEVAAIAASMPELRAELAVWTGHDLALRQRDLQELRRLAAEHLADLQSVDGRC